MTDLTFFYVSISSAFMGGTLFGIMLVRYMLERHLRRLRASGRDKMVEPWSQHATHCETSWAQENTTVPNTSNCQ